ncbi:MAG: hypothetical protein U0V48_16355 [Anaerolineales bacterium]
MLIANQQLEQRAERIGAIANIAKIGYAGSRDGTPAYPSVFIDQQQVQTITMLEFT